MSCITVFLWMNAGTISGLPETMDEREGAREPTDKFRASVDEMLHLLLVITRKYIINNTDIGFITAKTHSF